jgi:hypothetical protein
MASIIHQQQHLGEQCGILGRSRGLREQSVEFRLLDRKVKGFAAALKGATVGLFFYAGHGLRVAGQNYIVPIDAELTTQPPSISR